MLSNHQDVKTHDPRSVLAPIEGRPSSASNMTGVDHNDGKMICS